MKESKEISKDLKKLFCKLKLTKVKSSRIAGMSYYPNNNVEGSFNGQFGTLIVEFVKGSKRYIYHNVPEEVYNRVIKSDSVGTAFKVITDSYFYEKIS